MNDFDPFKKRFFRVRSSSKQREQARRDSTNSTKNRVEMGAYMPPTIYY